MARDFITDPQTRGLRVLLSSKEMSKSCILYELGKKCLESGDMLSSGVDFYFSLYHACLSVISSTSDKINVGKCVLEWKERKQLPRYYIPFKHGDVKKQIEQFDEKLAYELDTLMKIREYLSYGPNVLYKNGKQGRIRDVTIYCCKFPQLKKEISRLSLEIPGLTNVCCELLKKNLSEGNFHYFLFFFFRTTDILGENLDLEEPFISRCKEMLTPFDEVGMRNLSEEAR